MVFVRQTPRKLTVWDFSSGFWRVTLGFGIMGAFLIISSFAVTTLTCQRWSPIEGSCKLADLNLPWVNVKEIPLNTLQRAEFRTKLGSGRGISYIYKIVLLTQTGEIEIAVSSYKGEKENITDKINNFIKNPDQSFLQVRQDGQREKLFWGLFFWGYGLVALLFFGADIEVITCSIDKTLGRLTLKQRNSLFLPTGFIEHSIQDIDSAAIETTSHSKLNRFWRKVSYNKYYLVVVLKSGDRIRLAWDETVLLKSKQKVVDYISTIVCKNDREDTSKLR